MQRISRKGKNRTLRKTSRRVLSELIESVVGRTALTELKAKACAHEEGVASLHRRGVGKVLHSESDFLLSFRAGEGSKKIDRLQE